MTQSPLPPHTAAPAAPPRDTHGARDTHAGIDARLLAGLASGPSLAGAAGAAWTALRVLARHRRGRRRNGLSA